MAKRAMQLKQTQKLDYTPLYQSTPKDNPLLYKSLIRCLLLHQKGYLRCNVCRVLNAQVRGYILDTRTSVYIKSDYKNPSPCTGIKECLETFRLFMCPNPQGWDRGHDYPNTLQTFPKQITPETNTQESQVKLMISMDQKGFGLYPFVKKRTFS